MRPAELFRRMAALLVAVGLLAVSVAGVSADDGDEEAAVVAVAAELRPTRVAAEIPEGYGTLFPLQWGGGSLPQLKGRLAELGCAMNTLWLYDRDRWNGYNRYDLTYDFPTNQQFLQRYDREVPAGMLYATCADQPVGNGLQPTQIIAEIPEEYDTMFEVQWGGGSLLHFKGRLATMGCIANNIEIRDPGADRTYIYNQYNTNSTDRINQRFPAIFEQFLPAGTMQVDCYDIFEYKNGEYLSYAEAREQGKYLGARFLASKDATCTDDFHPLVKERVFSILPILPRTCIVRRDDTGTAHLKFFGHASGWQPINIQPLIFLTGNKAKYHRGENEYTDILLHVEIHELCHENQKWHWTQRIAPDLSHNFPFHAPWEYIAPNVREDFDAAVGYRSSGPGQAVPSTTIYRIIYNPRRMWELSAELCTLYILDALDRNSIYNYYEWNMWDNRSEEIPIRDFDSSNYLTPEVVEWLETYMILPEIVEAGAE